MSIDQQMEALGRGATEIVPREALAAKLEKSQKTGKPLQIKLGLDPTAPDIHLGHAVVLRKLRQFQDFGHNVTIVIGDFTAMIGDPTGRSETRKPLTSEKTRENAKTYAEQYNKILDPARTRIAFNSEWLGKLNLFDLIDLMSKTTVARLLERDDFSNRFNNGIPIHAHELMYPLCQAFDSVALNADVEIGGTDQRFNIMMGRDLQRERGSDDPQVALFMPILVGIDGVEKMSKSKGNGVGIDEPPLLMFEKLMSIGDSVMREYYELCTEVPLDEVKLLCDPNRTHPKIAKKHLAREIITIYHGESSADSADAEWERIHAQRELPEEIAEFTPSTDLFVDGKAKVVALIVAAGLAASLGEAKRLIQQGGVGIDGEKVKDPAALVEARNGLIFNCGRRKFARLVIAG